MGVVSVKTIQILLESLLWTKYMPDFDTEQVYILNNFELKNHRTIKISPHNLQKGCAH